MDPITTCVAVIVGTCLLLTLSTIYRDWVQGQENQCRDACYAVQNAMELLIGNDDDLGSRFRDFEVSVGSVGRYMHIQIVWRGDGTGPDEQPDRSMAMAQNIKFAQREMGGNGTSAGALAAAILTSAKGTLARHTPTRPIDP